EAERGTVFDVDGQRRLSFGSNDYLGLAQHPRLIEAAQAAAARYGVGATASPLVCGHSPAHEALEQELARMVGLPRALYFYAGFAANVGIVPALVGRGDAVFSDALNHACLIDGARLSRAEIHVYPHGDLTALDRALAASTARRKLVITDAVFSMDGNVADVPALLKMCERHDAWLLIDDAHGFGVLGARGEGTLAHFGLADRDGVAPAWQGKLSRLIYMATLGKAAGVSGAFVAGDPSVIEWIMQRARSYMFATGAPAMLAEALRASLQVIESEPQRRQHLATLRERLRQGLQGTPAHWRLLPSDTAIQPLIIGSNEEALSVMAHLEQHGIWVPAIRPPTVPPGTARLRISLSAAHSEDHVDQLCAALAAYQLD
ncbi:MAG TPA: 8-amino-7-oxononanoate synthase, partial [Aquabacterium sp.]|nr:8-amino-7-oxononanoate synthase [Aquabacterium sp.]